MKNANWVLGIILIVALVALLLGGAGMMGFGGFGMMGGYGGYSGMMGGYGFNPLGAILSLAFWALIIGGAVWLVVALARGAPSVLTTPNAGQTPLAILQARYAKGEITKEQFDEMRRDLGA